MTLQKAPLLIVCVCGALPMICRANAFLSPIDTLTGSMEGVSEDDVRGALLEEVEKALGSNVAETRIGRLEEILRPIFSALPKNTQGYLEHGAVRYALHRLFVQLHGWHIRGLAPGSDTWNSSSPTTILKDRVPGYIQDLFEERLGGRGMGLVELAILASTLEHLIHSEVVVRLGSSYKKNGMSTLDLMSAEQVDTAIGSYMISFIIGTNLTSMTDQEIVEMHSSIHEVYSFWNETQEFFRGVMKDVLQKANISTSDGGRHIDFPTATRIAEEIGERYGTFQNTECQQLKVDLLKLNDRNTGRILLSDFYRDAADGTSWQFSESPDYLRQLGALDDSDPSALRVIVPNYVGSSSNCIAGSSFFSVCCFDECEGLLGHLERHIAAPEAAPSRIADLVTAMSSTTVRAPRALSADLLQRLDRVANSNGGNVPLHGRLFSQWMHHAFPRECPYPHVRGVTNPLTPDEWEAAGFSPQASLEDMKRHIEDIAVSRKAVGPSEWESNFTVVNSMLWTEEEELLVVRSTRSESRGSGRQLIGNSILFAILILFVVSLARSTQNYAGQPDKRFASLEKAFV